MSLGDERRRFSRKIAVLVLVANEMGYEVAYGRGYASEAANAADGGHRKSVHLVGLGQDLNLYKDKVYITDGTGHKELHDVWDLMGGAERIERDMNHYSFAWQGVR